MENTETLEKQEIVFEIEKLEANQLPELQGLKEKQFQIVKENPFVEIVDNPTYEVAKKARTTLVTARTDIEKQDKLIASKIKKFREMVSGASEELIAITKPHEERQQDEVKRYEAIKEAEKAEKARLEEERKAKIKSAIDTIYQTELSKIDKVTFEQIEVLEADWTLNLFRTDVTQFEEFELDFNEKVLMLKNQFTAKQIQLKEKEAQRIENERLKAEKEKLDAERAELERLQKETKEKAEKEKKAEEDRLAKIKADQEAELEAQRQKLADEKAKQDAELKAQQDKIDAENKKIQDEKDRLAKIEADRIAKEESDRKAKEDAERAEKEKAENEARAKAEAARMEALKPDKEKATDFFEGLKLYFDSVPEFKDQAFFEAFENSKETVLDSIADAISAIKNFK